MLSIILYGRNDQHGYNYHKRLAISLNCLAEMLSFENDEIVFVDFQSNHDFPTVPQAIADTLTKKAIEKLKVLRIRPSSKLRKKGSILPAEPVSRNAAIQRTNPKNKWILSTNVDMIFVSPEKDVTLSKLVSSLDEGFYQLPRFELPESFWESQFDRLQPEKTLAFLKSNGEALHLNTIVRRPGFLLYDNPGDFQLMPRDLIFKLDGFNESMISGWHVDSNLCKRMSLFYGNPPKTLEGRLWGYHCNHTRQTTEAHKQVRSENDWETYVNRVTSPYLPKQKKTWGLSKDELEEVSLSPPKLKTVQTQIPQVELLIEPDRFNNLTYSSERIFPHLIDHFLYLPPQGRVVYIGYNSKLLSLLKQNVDQKIVTQPSKIGEFIEDSNLIIFDFGFDMKEIGGFSVTPTHELYKKMRKQLREVMSQFLRVVKIAKRKKSGVKLIGINALYTDFRALFHHHLVLKKNTFLSSLAFGHVKLERRFKFYSWKIMKMQLKFLFMYFVVLHCYRFSDRIRRFSCRNRFLRKIVSHR